VTVIPRGELDIATAGRLREVLRAHEDAHELLTVDLSRLEFIDASGLRVVLEERLRSRRDGFELRVIVGSGTARHLIDLIGDGWELD
jgi:anti-anti-sigma factor